MTSRPRFRFAPSPNGALHLGHAFSALLNAKIARERGGAFLLRIDDIDVTRCTPELEAAIFADLAWLGLEWLQPVRRQSEHFSRYRAALERLVGEGLVYPAFMSRGEIRSHIADLGTAGQSWPHDPDGAPLYPGLDRTLSAAERRRRIDAGAPFAWRLDMTAAINRAGGGGSWVEAGREGAGVETIAAQPQDWGDVIIARREIPTSYHLSVVVDDAEQEIAEIVRGRDLFHATAVHRLLQRLLGLPEPVYRHHRLILGADGRKLSKSRQDTGLAALREAGATPADIRRMVGLD